MSFDSESPRGRVGRPVQLTTTALAFSATFLAHVGSAQAQCASTAANSVTCSGATTSAQANAAITAQPGPTMNFSAAAGGAVNTTAEAILIDEPPFGGAITITNSGEIGLTANAAVGLGAYGGLGLSGNTVSATNAAGATVNNEIYILAGGAATVSNLGAIDSGSPTQTALSVQSAGKAAVSSSQGSTIEGIVEVLSEGTPNATTNAPSGGAANVNFAGNVGLTGAVAKTAGNPNGFEGSPIVVDGVGSATVTIGNGAAGSGQVGPILADTAFAAYSPPTTTTTTTNTTTGAVTTVVKSSTITGAGAASITLAAGAAEFGDIGNGGLAAYGAAGGASVDVEGNAQATGAANPDPNAVVVTAQGLNMIDSSGTETTITNSSGKVTSQTDTTSQTPVGGTATLVVGQTGQVEGGAEVTTFGAGTASIDGSISGNVGVTTTGADSVAGTSTYSITTTSQGLATGGSQITTLTTSTSIQTVSVAGGSVSGTYAGVVGLDNVSGGAVPGTLIQQQAAQASTVDITGSVYGENIQSYAGSGNTVSTSAATTTDVQSLSAQGGTQAETYAVRYSTTSTSSPNAGGMSTVTITGSVVQPKASGGAAEGASSVTSIGLSGSSVTLDGGTVGGAITAQSEVAVTVNDSVSTTSYAYGPGGMNAGNSDVTGSSTLTLPMSSTAAGGAASVDLSAGTNSVGGAIAAAGQTTATVNIGADSKVGGGVSASVNGADSVTTIEFYQTFQPATALTPPGGIEYDAYVNKVTPAPITGNVLVTLNGTVGGDAQAQALTGSAAVVVNNTVAGAVNASASGETYNYAEYYRYVLNGTPLKFTYGAPLTYTDGYTESFAGGAAVIDLTAPKALVSQGGVLVGNVKGKADAVHADGDGSSVINIAAGSIIAGNVEADSGAFAYANNLVIDYAPQTTEITTYSDTSSGGLAWVINAGTIRGAATIDDAGTGSAVVSNSGVITGNVYVIADKTNLASKTTTSNLGPPPATAPGGGVASNLGTPATSATDVTTYTAVGGSTTTTNSGEIGGGLHLAGLTNTATNSGGVGGGIFSNSALPDYTVTTVQTRTSTTSSVALPATLFSTSTTIEQDGLVLAANGGTPPSAIPPPEGIEIDGATVVNPVARGSALQTVNVSGAINLNNGSVTLGSIGDALASDVNPGTGLEYTDVNVNLNGTGFVGNAPAGVFSQSPTFNAAEEGALALTGATGAGAGSIIGVQKLTMNGPGTFYFFGSGYDGQGKTPFYDINAQNFDIVGGSVQFALCTASKSASTCSPTGTTYGIRANIDNAAGFVAGYLQNIGTASDPNTILNGITFTILGNVTQTSAGTLYVGINSPSGSSIKTTPSLLNVTGNVSLAGTLSVAVISGAVYANGASTEIMDVTGTVNLSSLKVVSDMSSQFVGFEVTTAPDPSHDGNTDVLVTTEQTSYAIAAKSDDARAAALALDSVAPQLAEEDRSTAKGLANSGAAQAGPERDMAGIITAMDWRVTAAQASQALSEMASGEAYGSLLAVDNTRLLHDAMSDFREANQRTAAAGEIVWLAPAARSTTYQGSLATGATGLTDNETGINGGVELRPSSTLGIGLAAGWRQGAIKSGDFFSATVDTIGAGADVTYQLGAFYAAADFIYGHDSYDARRSLPLLARSGGASFGGDEYRSGAEIGYDLKAGFPGVLTPFVSIDVRNTQISAFSENSGLGALAPTAGAGGLGGLALNVQRSSDTVTSPAVGLRWGAYSWQGRSFSLAPEFLASYTFQANVDTALTQQYAGGGNPFTTTGVHLGGYATIGAALRASAGPQASFWVRGSGDFGVGESGAAATVGADLRF
jgi:hypothetical protein